MPKPLLIAAALAMLAPGPTYPVKIVPGAFPDDRQPDGNTIVFEQKAGLVVVDTGRHLDHQAAILDYAKARHKPIVAIVNTHWHLDHSGGNQELRAVYPGAKLYTSKAIDGALTGFLSSALERGRARLAHPKVSAADKAETKLGVDALEDRKDLIPDVQVTGDMKLGRLELHLAPYAATEGDTWLYDPASRTLVAGDLVVIPAPFFDTACAEGWRSALDRIAAHPFETLVPGHGPALTRSQFETWRSAYGRLVDCAESSAPKQQCIHGWQKDAAPFLTTDKDRKDAQDLLDYYLDNILRAPDKQRSLCGPA
jgi:glyoxylase-like metal-dependent hydrolase (beta-lactamase superfamily II)